ncbi:MAG: glycoside hydrolase family 36 protein [Bacteroidota bacterium]
MKSTPETKAKSPLFKLIGNTHGLDIQSEERILEEGLIEYCYRINAPEGTPISPLKFQCTYPAKDIQGVWHPNSLHDKRLRADWEAPSLGSRVSVGAPVISLFGNQDHNRLTLACSEVVELVLLEAPVREEDNLIYASVEFFTEYSDLAKEYEIRILVDKRVQPFYLSLKEVSNWWNGFERLKAPISPPAAYDAVYSTWYAYHQSLDPDELMAECREAVKLGYKTIILDDGWQTEDSNRGYDFTGDWEAQRLTEMEKLVADIHGLGMKVMLWYSVPFCGVKSKAYQRFKGKFLTENHRWAPVFDPRYPEVRKYLVETYAKALIDWNLDGFKLDFIDDFKVYPETPAGKVEGRDFASIYKATEQLLGEIHERLTGIKPDVLIEFRQEYVGPIVQKHANMFRAFDCPNDAVTNRIRTTDLRLLTAEAAIHSDMFTWHPDEEVEIAALQILNILFSVPQLSVRLNETSEAHVEMIKFLTNYWNKRREVFMHGNFEAFRPLANYPLLKGDKDGVLILASFENQVLTWEERYDQVDLVNAGPEDRMYVRFDQNATPFELKVYDCKGNERSRDLIHPRKGILEIEVPHSGLAMLDFR